MLTVEIARKHSDPYFRSRCPGHHFTPDQCCDFEIVQFDEIVVYGKQQPFIVRVPRLACRSHVTQLEFRLIDDEVDWMLDSEEELIAKGDGFHHTIVQLIDHVRVREASPGENTLQSRRAYFTDDCLKHLVHYWHERTSPTAVRKMMRSLYAARMKDIVNKNYRDLAADVNWHRLLLHAELMMPSKAYFAGNFTKMVHWFEVNEFESMREVLRLYPTREISFDGTHKFPNRCRVVDHGRYLKFDARIGFNTNEVDFVDEFVYLDGGRETHEAMVYSINNSIERSLHHSETQRDLIIVVCTDKSDRDHRLAQKCAEDIKERLKDFTDDEGVFTSPQTGLKYNINNIRSITYEERTHVKRRYTTFWSRANPEAYWCRKALSFLINNLIYDAAPIVLDDYPDLQRNLNQRMRDVVNQYSKQQMTNMKSALYCFTRSFANRKNSIGIDLRQQLMREPYRSALKMLREFINEVVETFPQFIAARIFSVLNKNDDFDAFWNVENQQNFVCTVNEKPFKCLLPKGTTPKPIYDALMKLTDRTDDRDKLQHWGNQSTEHLKSDWLSFHDWFENTFTFRSPVDEKASFLMNTKLHRWKTRRNWLEKDNSTFVRCLYNNKFSSNRKQVGSNKNEALHALLDNMVSRNIVVSEILFKAILHRCMNKHNVDAIKYIRKNHKRFKDISKDYLKQLEKCSADYQSLRSLFQKGKFFATVDLRPIKLEFHQYAKLRRWSSADDVLILEYLLNNADLITDAHTHNITDAQIDAHTKFVSERLFHGLFDTAEIRSKICFFLNKLLHLRHKDHILYTSISHCYVLNETAAKDHSNRVSTRASIK